MSGGGFGCSVLALLPTGSVGTVRISVTEAFSARGWTLPQFLDAVPSPPARRLS
jgi:galactokinase